MSLLDIIAHPVSLWALGLIGSLTRTLLRKHEETDRRVMPWEWMVASPGKAVSAVVGSVILLAVLERAEMLDGAGLLPALLAVGAGALGPEALPKILDKSKAALDKALNQSGNQRGEAPILTLGIAAVLLALIGMGFVWPDWVWWALAAAGMIAPVALAIIIVHDDGWQGLLLRGMDGVERAVIIAYWTIIAVWWVGLLAWWALQAWST